MNVSCVECGPPPDAILHIPPPPLPTFLQRSLPHDADVDAVVAAAEGQPACAAPCAFADTPAVEYVELPRQGPALDDTWLLVLVSSCAGVLLLGALLALLLLKCKLPRSGKGALSLDGPPLAGGVSKGCEAVLYPDSRLALWAMLTPRGTAHHLADASAAAAGSQPPAPPPAADNSAFVDCEAEAGSPRVSPPTRIQHPNLPPLNLLPRRPRRAQPDAAPPAVL